MSDPLRLSTTSARETRELGRRLGANLRRGDVLLLHGDLGAGKTTLTQGIGDSLGVTEQVQSPTFTLVQEHVGRTGDGEEVALYHLDLYRLDGVSDLESFGFEQYLPADDGIAVVEWPERAGSWLPSRYLGIEIIETESDARTLLMRPVPGMSAWPWLTTWAS